MRKNYFLFLLAFLASCTPRGEITLYAGATDMANVQRIFLSTTREINAMGFPSGKRSRELIFGRFDVSIPEIREPGSIIWPNSSTPDPSLHFLVENFSPLERDTDFQTALRQELRTRRKEARTAIVFVHGFNNRFSEGLYRFAQLTEDLKLPFLPVHYSWPSAGHPLGYGYDRDSMLFARDGLEETLRSISKSGADEILLVAHSMGALLAMETIRQMAISDGDHALKKLGGVVLISPDIDIDVFHQQAKRIGKLPKPFFIFTSTRDIALRLSAGIAGQTARLGNTDDVAQLAELDVTMVDISAFSDGGLEHSTALASPSFLRLLQSVPDLGSAYGTDPALRPGLIPGTVLVVQNATRLIVPKAPH